MRLFGLLGACIGLLVWPDDGRAQPREPLPLSDGEVRLELHAIRIARPPEGTSGILVARPAIAAVRIGPSGELSLTGTEIGTTRFVLLDRGGRVLSEGTIHVTEPNDWLRVTAGPVTSVYGCSSECSPVQLQSTSGDAGASPTAGGPRQPAVDGIAGQVARGLGAGGASVSGTGTAR